MARTELRVCDIKGCDAEATGEKIVHWSTVLYSSIQYDCCPKHSIPRDSFLPVEEVTKRLKARAR